MLTVLLEDVMSHPVITASPDARAHDIAETLHEHDIGSVVIVENNDVLEIVTESDVIEAIVDDRREAPVSDWMSAPLVTAKPTDTVQEAISKLEANRIKHLPILTDHLVGLVSTRDLSYYLRRHHDHHVSNRLEVSYEDEDWEFEHVDRDEGENVSVGDMVRFTKRLDEDDVHSFADASGDTNRVHLDEEFARKTRFKERIVHGTLVSGLISSALARIPGLTIYLSQELTFLKPVPLDEVVTAVCEIVENLGKNRFRLVTRVFREDGEMVIDGEATVLVDPFSTENSQIG